MDRVHEHRENLDEEMFDNDALSDEEVSSMTIDDESVPDDEIWSHVVGDDPNLTSLEVGINVHYVGSNDYHPLDGDYASLG